MRILIVEDEKRLAATLADLLENAGYRSHISTNGSDGIQLARSGVYDAMILDVMLPGMDGFQIVRQLRSEKCSIPVLMLTARSQLTDRIRGLDSGADYYLTKPFENEELLACLRTILRRPVNLAPAQETFGDLTLAPATCQLSCNGQSVTLSAKELEMMKLLISNSRQFLPKETLLLKVWGYDASVNANSVEAYISFLRKKLTLLNSCVQIIVLRNVGYKLEVTK